MTTKKVETDTEGKLTGRVLFLFDDHKPAKDNEPGVDSFEVFELTKVPGAETLDPNTMAGRLAIHGASQKIGDSYAGVAKETDPLAMAKANVKDTIAQLYAGTWRVNAGGGPRVNDLAVAISRVTGEPLEGEDGCIAYVAAMSEDDKKAERAKPKIKAALAAIAAEKAIERAKKAAEAAAAAEAAEAPPATA
jgi:hypothetical protein